MVYFKGSLSFVDLENMPIDRIIHFNELANKIERRNELRSKQSGF